MVQRLFFNHYLARTAGMLLGATRRAAMLLLVMMLTMVQTAWATDKELSGSENYEAQTGDVLTGSTSGTVTIANNAKITLSDVTITGGIVCAGTAEITLVGTNSVTGFSEYDSNINAYRYTAGIQVGGSGTTLTIKGDGSLTANGALHSAGIGLSRAWDVDATGGHIVIEGGNITATGNGKGAGIGTGACWGGDSDKTATLGNITIKGGTVRAIGGTDNSHPGNGIGKGGAYLYGHAVVGTITIYDGIDKVDASSISESVTYMHVENETETDVTANKSDYFTIIEDGNRRVITPKDDTDYTITIADGIEHGTLTGAATAKYMENVTITATPDFGYRLSRLVVKDAQNNDVESTDNSFFMPKSNVTVSAVFEQSVHGTTEFALSHLLTGQGWVTDATIYDGVTTVNLQEDLSYSILKYEGNSRSIFRLDNDTYAADIPYSGGIGTFYNSGNPTEFILDGEATAGYYDITMTEADNGKWNVSILKTAGQMDVVPDQTYTGSAITPEPLVIAGSLSLTKGTDYVYSYTNNTNVGTAKVRATFQGTYAWLGYVEKEFTIVYPTVTTSYVDATGTLHENVEAVPLDNTMTTLAGGWYVVNSDVEFSGNLSTNASGKVHIILCDGATLTANNIGFVNSNRLYIYGQSQGTGTANISGNIMGNYSVSIYGGTINVTGNIICPQGSIGIYGGTVTAGSLVALNTGSQIGLGGATVKANSYSAHDGVTILTGITYYDGTGASYTAGNLDAGQISAIEGKTLRTYDYRGGTCGMTSSDDVTWLYNVSTKTLTISGTGAMADYAEASGQPWTAMHSDIKAIVINEGVTSIGNYAFSLCEYVTSGVSIPASVTSIGNYSFNYCSMTSLTIPSNSSLETIGSFAFNCAGFGSVTIPASVKSIGNNAFDGSAALTTVTLNSNPFIGESAFYSSTAVTMNLTANGPVDGAYWATFYNKNYSFEADANTQVFKAALSGTALTLTELTTDKIVNKDNAVILKSTASPIVMTLTTDGSNDFTGNSLQGVDNPDGKTAADPSTTYVLNNGSNGVGFYKLTAGKTLGVGKAYLTYSGTTAPGFFGLDVDNENTTAINEHELNESHELSGAWYTLSGVRLNAKPTQKGLYIVNGKKIMIK